MATIQASFANAAEFFNSLLVGQAQETAVSKRLASWLAIIAVPTAVAGIYGMNFKYMPELSWPLGYAFSLALMAGAVVIAVTWFRRNGWF